MQSGVHSVLTSQFKLDTFQSLNSHIWLVAMILNSICLEKKHVNNQHQYHQDHVLNKGHIRDSSSQLSSSQKLFTLISNKFLQVCLSGLANHNRLQSKSKENGLHQ